MGANVFFCICFKSDASQLFGAIRDRGLITQNLRFDDDCNSSVVGTRCLSTSRVVRMLVEDISIFKETNHALVDAISNVILLNAVRGRRREKVE